MYWRKYDDGPVPEEEILFQVELNLDTSLGEISAGPFVFDQGVTLKKSKKDWKKNKEKYQEEANWLMTRHYKFYQSLCDEEYVTSGSIVSCSNGSIPITIQLPEDHGVIAENGKPLLTCKDCEAGTHIGSFGVCNCDPKNYYRLGEFVHHPSELSGSVGTDGRGKYKCFPILSHDWITKNHHYMIKVVNIEADFHAALDKGAVLICLYGGLITIDEVPEAELEDEELGDESQVDIAENEEDIIYISWLKCYKGEPEDIGGRIVTYDTESRAKLKDIKPKIDWYSFEGKLGHDNIYTEPYLQGQNFNRDDNGILYDQDGRYWITLGPRVIDPEYPNDGACLASDFAEDIGSWVDVVLRNMETEEHVYFKAIWSGNIKAHTYGYVEDGDNIYTYEYGIFQTGCPYPNSDAAKREPYSKGYVDGSIVEFTGKKQEDNKELSKYVVEYLVVYKVVG